MRAWSPLMSSFQMFLSDHMIAIVAGSLFGFMLLIVWLFYNRLAALDERCDTALADVDALLKHRHDLIPGLIETVRGFAGHESAVLTEVTRARASALRATRPDARLEAEIQLGQSINSLLSVVENYPDLQAGNHFRELRAELTDTHNRITAARRFYNLAVNEFNSTLRQFPANLVGSITRLARRKAFDIGAQRDALEAPIPVKF
jgi:LemA protein